MSVAAARKLDRTLISKVCNARRGVGKGSDPLGGRASIRRFASGHGFTGCGETRLGSRGAKARPILAVLLARLKSCPSRKLLETEFFCSLFRHAKARAKDRLEPLPERPQRPEAKGVRTSRCCASLNRLREALFGGRKPTSGAKAQPVFSGLSGTTEVVHFPKLWQ